MVYIDINILSDKIEFSIFRNFSNNKKILKRNEIIFPICYSSPQRLNYIRNLMGSFIEEYNIGHYKVNIGNLDKDEDIKDIISKLTDEMLQHAANMEFEKAAELRDKIKELEKLI